MKAAVPSIAVCALAAAVLSACQAQKSSNPLSPTVAGPIPGVDISAPGIVTPTQGAAFRDTQQPITLTVQNATTTGVRPLSYVFEVASDSAFATKVFNRSGITPGDGKTSVTLDTLTIGKTYYWRVHAEDGANTGPDTAASFQIYPHPAINAPSPSAPAPGSLVSSTRPTLTTQDAQTTGPVDALGYEFQVSLDQAFTQLVSAGIVPEQGGQTSFTTATLANSATFYWRVRASDGTTTSAWSTTLTFKTPAAAPTPTPTPTPAPGGTCTSSNPETIVSCERAKYGHMSSTDTVNFLTSVAISLQRNGIAGGPFGLLRKSGGSNCNGYSCDIICAGQGNAQKQWDVLGDSDGAQTPAWNGPSTVPNIRVDTCDIKQ